MSNMEYLAQANELYKELKTFNHPQHYLNDLCEYLHENLDITLNIPNCNVNSFGNELRPLLTQLAFKPPLYDSYLISALKESCKHPEFYDLWKSFSNAEIRKFFVPYVKRIAIRQCAAPIVDLEQHDNRSICPTDKTPTFNDQ